MSDSCWVARHQMAWLVAVILVVALIAATTRHTAELHREKYRWQAPDGSKMVHVPSGDVKT